MLNAKEIKITLNYKEKYKVNINEIQLPKYVLLPLESQNSKSMVYITTNQKIDENQLLSRSINPDYYIYSPISGIVEKIFEATLPDGRTLKSALIRFEGRLKNEEIKSNEQLLKKEILEKLIKLGIPWFTKDSFFEYIQNCEKIEKMILLITGKDSFTDISLTLIKEKLNEIIYGFEKLNDIFSFKEIIIVISNEKLKEELEKTDIFKNKEISLRLLPNTYPYANHEMLFRFLNQNINDKENLNPKRNILLANLEDLFNIYLALNTSNPYKEKILAINGNKYIKSKIIKVKIGTSLSEIIENKINIKKYDIFVNNPVNKIKIKDLNIPITRDIYSITILKKETCFSKIKFPNISSFSPLLLEDLILSNLKNGTQKNKIDSKLKFLEPKKKDVEEEIIKVQKEIKDRILSNKAVPTLIYTENNLKGIYFTIIMALIPGLLFSFLNNAKFLGDTAILFSISIVLYIPIMIKFRRREMIFFGYSSLMISILMPLYLPLIIKILSLLFLFIIFFYFSKISNFFVNPVLISFLFILISFPLSFKQTYSEELQKQNEIIPRWNQIISSNSYVKNLTSLESIENNRNNVVVDNVEKFINHNIFSYFNISIPRLYVANILGYTNEKNLSPLLIYIGIAFILGKFILNGIIPLIFYITLIFGTFLLRSIGVAPHISSDILLLILSPVTLLLVTTMAIEIQIIPPFRFEQIIYGILLSVLYLLIISYIPFETFSIIIAIFILQVISSLIKEYSLTLRIKQTIHYINNNKEKKLKNKNGENIIGL